MGLQRFVPSTSTVTTVVCVALALYLALLLVVNAIPHVSVKSIGWFGVRGITLELGATKVTIGQVVLKFSIAWSSDAPFRMFNVVFHNVEVITTTSSQTKQKPQKGEVCHEVPTTLTFPIPYRVYNVLVARNWLNELAFHCHHLSYTHHEVHEDISFHLDYLRVEGVHAFELGNHLLAISAIDGYIRDRSGDGKVLQTRLLHNLELGMSYGLLFSCLLDNSKRMVGELTKVGFSFAVGDLYIPNVPHIFDNPSKSKQESKKGFHLPSRRTVLAILNLLTSVQVKIEQSVVEYKEMRLESSSYSINFTKDTSFKQQVIAKVSSYIVSGKVSHLGLKCAEIPSLTHLFETDLTDVYRAYAADEEQYFIDVTTSLNITHPAFAIYFDQFAYLFESLNSKKSSGEVARTENKIPRERLIQIMGFLKKFRKVSAKLVIMDVVGTLHTPNIDEGDFRRDARTNIVSDAGIALIAFKSSSKNLGKLIERKCMGGSVPLTIKSHLKMKSIRLEVGENQVLASNFNALVGYCVDSNSIGLKITSKKFQIRSVNTMIFHVVRRVQEARINHYNKACSQVKACDWEKFDSSEESLNQEAIEQGFLDIFSLLPPIVSSVSFQATQILFILIFNDSLPSHILKVSDADEEIDLATFKRGVSFALNEVDVSYRKCEEVFRAVVRQIQASTMSDFSKEYIDDFDQVTQATLGNIDFDDISSLGSHGESLEDFDEDLINKVKRVMSINDLLIENPKGVRDKLIVHVPEFDARIDIFLVWCVTYAQTLVKMNAPKVEKHYSPEQVRQLQGSSKKINLDIEIDSISLVTRLVHDVDVMLEVDSLHLENVLAKPQSQIRYCRLFVVQPTTKLWSRLVSITDTYADLENLSTTTFTLNSKSVRLNIPFQYLVYTVIDNVITFVKAIRQIRQNFEHLSQNNDDFGRILPDAKPAVKMPKVRWKARTFGLTLENDTFETELAMIYELGAIEQIDRIRKQAYFEEKEKEIRSKVNESLTKASVNSRRFLNSHDGKKTTKRFNVTDIGPSISESFKFTKKLNGHAKGSESKISGSNTSKAKHHEFKWGSSSGKHSSEKELSSNSGNSENGNPHSDTGDDELPMTEDRANEIIALAKETLDKDFATAWIHKYRKFKDSRHKHWNQLSRDLWGEDEINPTIKSKYAIQDYAPGVLQFCGIFRDFDLTIDDPHIADIDKFLYDYGKGQPKLDYSILIPLYIHLRSSFVYFRIKDYVLPLLSFPSAGNNSQPVMDFLGNLVINEKLVYTKEEMRHIFVPFSPAVQDPKEGDNFYGAHIIRTLTPVKFMFDLSCNLKTDRACVFSWSKSYLPALSSIMSSFDNFTKPEIDDSPLGWWDKVALLAHGRLRFNIENELCLHIKSSTSPYKLVGEDSGLVFCWKDNVALKINDTGHLSEIVILESDDFILGIPNYSTAEKRTWSLCYDDSGYVHDTSSESRKFLKRVMKLSSDEKVRWTLGFLFEQNVDREATELSSNQERTEKFKPHYDVSVTSPEFEWHPDSYEDYRSDYIHMAISVKSTSVNGNSYNAAYFTPLTFQYFFAWWGTLSDTISLPIREGSLFSRHVKDKSLVKMGPHLFTFKYQLELEPLTISHMYVSSSSQTKDLNVVKTGLKGKFSKCVIDLHQRKEVVRYVNEKLGINKKVRKLKMNLGEVDISDADIRLVHAAFNDTSLRAQLLSHYAGESSDPRNPDYDGISSRGAAANNTDWFRRISITDNDFLWWDQEDFVELEEKQILSADPAVEVIPFYFTPKFTYFREFTLESPEGEYPFGNEASHRCLIGAQAPEKVQEMLLKKRVDALHKEIQHDVSALQQLEEINDPVFKNDYNRIKSDIHQNEEKMDQVNLIYEDIKNTSRPASLLNTSTFYPRSTISETSSLASMNKVQSRQPSVYSNFKSLEDARDVVLANNAASDYHNRFLLHNLQLKWNNRIRDLFMTYLLLVGEKKALRLSMTKKAIDLVDSLLKNAGVESDEASTAESTGDEQEEDVKRYFNAGEDVTDGFDEYLQSIDDDGQEIELKYLIRLIRPQVQMVSDADLESCILETSRQVEMRIINVNIEGTNDIISEGAEEISLIETRYGVLFQDSHLFAFDRSKFPDVTSNPYGIPGKRKTWPPWVDLEVCDDSSWLEDDLIIDRTSMALSLKKPNTLSANASDRGRPSELVVNLAKLVFNATSAQYSAMYFVVTDLLMHARAKQDAFHQRLEQILAVSDISDYAGLSEKVQQLQVNIRVCRNILLKMDEKQVLLSDKEQRDRAHVEMQLETMKLDLDLIITGLQSLGLKAGNSQRFTRNWHIRAEQVIWHFLEDNREPLLDLALATSLFSRVDHYDGSNSNVVDVSMIQGFNLRPKAAYPELLRPYLEILDSKDRELCQKDESMIKMTWKMLSPVGGIRVMSNAQLLIQPVHIQLDYDTATKMFSYLFPKDENLTNESLPLADDSDSLDLVSLDSNASSETSSNPFRKLMARRRNKGSSSPSRTTSGSSNKRDDSFESSSFESNGSKSTHKSDVHENNGKHHHPALFSPRKSKRTNTKVDEVALIMNRSSKYIVIGEVKVKKMKLCVSFKAPKHLNIIDVHNLKLSVPSLHYENKTWTGADFANQVKKDIIKVVLSHSGKIIGNKFKQRHRKAASSPLKQISDYSHYMSLDDLEANGRSRDEKRESLKLVPDAPQREQMPPKRTIRVQRPREMVDLSEVLETVSEDEDDLDGGARASTRG